VQTAGGMQMVFTNYNVDASLLLMNSAPPAGARYAPLNAARMAGGEPVVSLSHPRGDTARRAEGVMGGEGRDNDRPYDMYVVNFSRGIIEGGSSGSGIYTRTANRLELRGVLSQGAVGLSCERPDLFALYTRMDVLHPQMAQYIGAAAAASDDAPNRVQDSTAAVSAVPLNARAQPLTFARRIDYPGDIDLFRFTVTAPTWVSAFTTGSQDTVSTLLDAAGGALEANDDAEFGDVNTGITRRLEPGTYHYSVAHWTPGATGPYGVTLRADNVDANYTALWWNAQESGWGLNVNHQGNTLFATLFTYDLDGTPLWLVMSNGARGPDGAFEGVLFRTTGPAFNAQPWGAFSGTPVGTLRLAFAGPESATLTYSYLGTTVTKAITRQTFRTPPECGWSAFDRSWEGNYQDLWWNPAESGWGVNLTHQEDIVFATLFTYGFDGRGLWLVMPEGVRSGPRTFSGALFRTTGPRFDASPWSPINPVEVGTMTLDFDHGNAGTLSYSIDGVSVTKQIQRQVFATPATRCDS
jgi:lysyl endopeptidase